MNQVCCIILLTLCSQIHYARCDINFRLSRDVVPKLYEILIKPNFDTNTFQGEVKIVICVERPVDEITLHIYELHIEKVELDYTADISFQLDQENYFLHISREDHTVIPAGEHIIAIKYSGVFGTYFGLFTYKENNQTIMASKFEETFARRAFPCFDEPFFKAKFGIKILKPDEIYMAISNMPQTGSYITESGVIAKFQQSPPMSTYLVALSLITNFSSVQTRMTSRDINIPIRLYSKGDHGDNLAAANYARQALNYLIQYTDIVYSLPKLDMLALPVYPAGGMEHWGFIIFSASRISRSKDDFDTRTELEHKFFSMLLVSHEVSHMYFGNLVTPAWYGDMWLKEGIARYMEFKIVDSIVGRNSEISMMDFLPSIYGIRVYQSDTRSSSRPIVSQIDSAKDIASALSDIVYSKGAMIMRMINSVLGENKFQASIQKYLRDYQYKSVSTGDFIEVLQATGPDVDWFNFLEEWLYRNRYPILTVIEDEQTKTFKVTQECVPNYSNASDVCSHRWTIPISYITARGGEPQFRWFDKDSSHVSITKDIPWIKLNHNSDAVYLTNYQQVLWDRLTENFHVLNSQDKAGLLNDAFALYKLNKVPCSVPLSLIEMVTETAGVLTWGILSEYPFDDFKIYNLTTSDKIMQKYYLSMVEKVYRKINWTTEGLKSIHESMGDELPPNRMPPSSEIPEKVLECSEWVNNKLRLNVN